MTPLNARLSNIPIPGIVVHLPTDMIEDVDAGTLRAGRKKEAKKPIKVRRRWDKVVKEVKKMLRTTSFLAKRKRDEVDEGDLMR